MIDQLLVERACKALIIAYQLPNFPGDMGAENPSFPIYCAHESKTRDAEKADYLDVIAGFPRWNGACWEVPVAFQLLTAIADESKRPVQSELHVKRFGDLHDLWSCDDNFDAVLALMNAPIVAGVGFTGWEEDEEDPGSDGPAENNVQLVARPQYVFDCHAL